MDKLVDLIKKGFALALLAAVAYLGETGKDGGFIKDIWAAAKTASPFAAMFAVMAWLSERQERRGAQEQLLERTMSFVEATNNQSSAMEKMIEAIKQISEALRRKLGKR